MITRDKLRQSAHNDPVTGNTVLRISLNMNATDVILKAEDTPEKREEVFEYMTQKAMRFIHDDFRRAIEECYHDVMPNLGMGANYSAASQAFEKLRAMVPK